MWKLARIATAVLALTVLAVMGTLIMTGCDDDSATFPTPPATNTPATKRSTTAPNIVLNEVNLFGNFTDVTGPVTPDRNTAKVIQTLSIFNHPQSCAASADGRYLFVTNSGVTVSAILGQSVQYYKGAVSKLEIDADGRLKVVNVKFVDGLHAPMGIAVLPKATAKFPAGSLFVSTGMTAGLDEKGDHIADITKFNPGVSIFDPDNGKMLGFIPMGPGRAVAKTLRHAVLTPAGLCFDTSSGDLYVADTGNTGKDLDPVVNGRPGILRISNAIIDSYGNDKENIKDKATIVFTPVRHEPAAIFYSSIDDALYWTTCDGQPPILGGVFRVERESFAQKLEENILGGVGGPLMGVTITPNGNLIASQINGDLKYMLQVKNVLGEIEFTENGTFSSPGDIKLFISSKKFNILYVPEQEPNSDEPWKQRLRVVMLPKAL